MSERFATHRSLTAWCRTCGVSIDEEYAGEGPFDEWDVQCWQDEHRCEPSIILPVAASSEGESK